MDKKTKESGLQYYTGVKKHGKEYMKKAAQAGRDGASQEELGRLKDKYSKAEKNKTNEGLGELADVAERDHEVQMARADLYKIAKYAIKLHDMLKTVSEAEGIEGWQQSKITKAADYMGSVYHALDYDMKFAESRSTKNVMKRTVAESEQSYLERLSEKVDRKLGEEKKGLYYYVNKRKKAGTSRSKNHPDAPSEKDWKNAAKTAKESVEGICSECGKPSYTTLPEEKQKGVDGKVCWKGYKRMGTKKKAGKTVDNCVKM